MHSHVVYPRARIARFRQKFRQYFIYASRNFRRRHPVNKKKTLIDPNLRLTALPSRHKLREEQPNHLVRQTVNGKHFIPQRPVQQKDGGPRGLVSGVHPGVVVSDQLLFEPVEALLFVQVVLRVEFLDQIVPENQNRERGLLLLPFGKFRRHLGFHFHLAFPQEFVRLGTEI